MSVGNFKNKKNMGCDIHSFAERRNKQTNKWEKVEDAFSLDNYDKERLKKDKGENPFDWRSYSMFAFLAGVRNYDHCEQLSEPKGLPDDISDEVKEEYGEGWDYHSASFLTAKELLDFDYDKTNLDEVIDVNTKTKYIKELIRESGRDDTTYELPTKNGSHLVCPPFHVAKYIDKYGELSYLKDAPTILYIP